MSYCRWSSEGFRCDVYVYESTNGWVTHVAGRRREPIGDPCPRIVWTDAEELKRTYDAQHAWLKDENEGKLWRWVDVPDPYAGETYNDASPGECADRLEALKAAGLVVPQYVIDSLREEQAEMEPVESSP